MSLINTEVPDISKQKMHEFLWVIGGRNKIGKTTLANNFPSPYFFLFEPGTSGLTTYETDILSKAKKKNKHPWQLFKDAVEEFVENDGYQFKTAVVDPVSTAYDYCEEYVCNREGIDHISDLPYGQGYQLVRDEFSDVLKQLHTGNFTSLLISHTKDKMEKDGLGNEVTVIDLDITGKSGKFIKNYTDIFLLLDFDKEGKRKIFVRPSTDQEAGSRLNFPNNEIDMSYESLKEEFDKAIKENNEKQGVTQEMIDEYYTDKKKKQEKQKKLKEKQDEIKDLAKEVGLNGTTNAVEMNKEIGKKSIKKLTLEEAEQYIDYLKNDYEG